MGYADLEVAGLWRGFLFEGYVPDRFFHREELFKRHIESTSEFTGFGDGEFAVAVFDLEVGRARDAKHRREMFLGHLALETLLLDEFAEHS